MQKNYFGLEISPLCELFRDYHLKTYIADALLLMMAQFKVPPELAHKVVDDIIEIAGDFSAITDPEYEKQAHSIYLQAGLATLMPIMLRSRPKLIYSQIRGYLIDGRILDCGCGEGMVGKLLSNDGYGVIVADVYEHARIRNLNLEFILLNQDAPLPFPDDYFNNVLLLTVLHHSDNPDRLLKEVHRIARNKGRVIVIESSFGIDIDGFPENEQVLTKRYVALNAEQQLRASIFFDHFFNRVVQYSEQHHTKVNVPFNLNTPAGWGKIFGEHGLIQDKMTYLGIDQAIIAEFHTLHVLSVAK